MESTMTLTGYVGHNIEVKQTRAGVSTVSFRVGTTPRVRTETGWVDGTTTWTNVVCYRSLAENVARCVSKGDPVIVHGKVRTQSWTDAQGTQREKMVVEAGTVGHDLNRGVSAFARPSMRVFEGSSLPDSGGAGDDGPGVTDDPFEEAQIEMEEVMVLAS